MHKPDFTDGDSIVAPGGWIEVQPIHCHQRLAENTLVSKVRRVSQDSVFTETLFRLVPEELPFFFDHEIDHLPGMLQVNAMRQATLALAHLLYGVPLDFVALLDWIEIKSLNYGELYTPTIMESKLLDSFRSRHKITLTFDGLLVQGEVPIMRAKGKLVMLSALLASRLRHKKVLLEAV